jgi:diketogulonate reductase-like aldo/keto reductase
VLTAYSPLAQGALLDDEVLAAIAAAHGQTSAQVALRWLLQKGISAIPRSQSPARQAANFDLFDYALTDAEVERMGVAKTALH